MTDDNIVLLTQELNKLKHRRKIFNVLKALAAEMSAQNLDDPKKNIDVLLGQLTIGGDEAHSD